MSSSSFHKPNTYLQGLAAGPLGESIPPGEQHAISVSLPTWSATLGWASRDPAVVDKMQSGYPRFFIHRSIVTLCDLIVETFAKVGAEPEAGTENVPGSDEVRRQAMLFPDRRAAERCAAYITRVAASEGRETPQVELLVLGIDCPGRYAKQRATRWANLELRAVLFPKGLLPLAKAFWQHTGFGISSRYAEDCLETFGRLRQWPRTSEEGSVPSGTGLNDRCHGTTDRPREDDGKIEKVASDYGAAAEKGQIQARVAGSYSVEKENVLLYPTGMTGITSLVDAIQALAAFEGRRSLVAYGFLYVDTFKVLSRIHSTPALLYGHCTASELDRLEHYLESGHRISAVFIEAPGNPLLMTPDIRRLRQLADEHNFLLITDDTVGTPCNIVTHPWSDANCCSLTKMFSGGCNTMGGAVVLNSKRRHFAALRDRLKERFHDTYHPKDARVMELNSRNFPERIVLANRNADMVVSILREHPTVAQLFHPSVSPTKHLYDALLKPAGGYSYLLSVLFKTPTIAVAFFDALDVAKGPSLGTDFTLACPYTLFAHYQELEWAAEHGVRRDLVRISVGIEDGAVLRRKLMKALGAASEAAGDRHRLLENPKA